MFPMTCCLQKYLSRALRMRILPLPSPHFGNEEIHNHFNHSTRFYYGEFWAIYYSSKDLIP